MTTIRENLLALRAGVEAHPEELLDLAAYKQRNSCGTLYCTFGLATTLPHFRELGMYIDGNEAHGHSIHLQGEGEEGSRFADWPDRLFGEDAYDRLFQVQDAGEFDRTENEDGLLDKNPRLTGKQLALARIDKQLENYP